MNIFEKILLIIVVSIFSAFAGYGMHQTVDSYRQTQNIQDSKATKDEKIMLDVSKEVSAKTGIPQKLIFAQLCTENGGTKISKEHMQDKNLSGLTYPIGKDDNGVIGTKRPKNEGGNYTRFQDWSDFAIAYANKLIDITGGEKINDVDRFTKVLADSHYFLGQEALKKKKDHATENDEKNYANNLRNYISTYDKLVNN